MPPYRIKPATLAFALCATLASAEYAPVEIETVPVERLLKNLGDIVEKDPKNAGAVLNLARVHAMAYSLRKEELQVRKEHPDSLWVGYEAPFVPFRTVTPTQDPEKLKAAKVHLDAAITLYGDALKLSPDDVIAQLGYGWLLTQTDKKAEAVAALRKACATSWKITEKAIQEGRGSRGPNSLVEESGQYLLPLLNPEGDREEIATLKSRTDLANKQGRWFTPIAVPLKAGLIAADLEDGSASVEFDVDGSNLPRRWTWTTRDAAWLVWDPRHSGKITSGLQLFGSVSFWLFWESGYDAMAALDDNHDGMLAGRELEGLALWQDANGNGISDPGEVQPLSSYGIVALSCRSERLQGHPDRIVWSPVGVMYRDGSTRPTFDLVLHSR